ncbi:hypothetical protein B0H17DRAFT_1287118, partial [Mycena rosella]
CPACGKQFRTSGGTQSHLKQSRHCAWYRKGKNPEGRRRTMRTPSPDPPPIDENTPLDPVAEIPVEEQVREKLGLSYKNIRGLHQIVDDIPERAGEWMTKSLSFPDRPGEKHFIRYRDPLAAIRSLLGNPAHAKDIVYVPTKVFSDAQRDNRVYNEMWTGKWWTAVQSKLPKGAALAPVIIATDKTQLTQFSGGKSAYPVYLTLGNIPKALRRKPSQSACVLLGYLSVDKILRSGLSKQGVKTRNQKLFHASMRLILQPLIDAGNKGMEVVGGDGNVRLVFPILASYVADYPEQCLVGCAKYGTCPKCQRSAADLQDPITGSPRTPDWTLSVIHRARKQGQRTSFMIIVWTTRSPVFTAHFGRDSRSLTFPFPSLLTYCINFTKVFSSTLLVGAKVS